MQQTLASVLLLAMIVMAVLAARNKARESAADRRRVLLLGVGAVALGLALVLVFPRMLPETPGSPGTLVGVALFWIFGSLAIGAGVTMLLGAALATRLDDENGDVR